MAVNEETNQVYVGDETNNVSVIDGATNGLVTTIPIDGRGKSVAVNYLTNRIYVTTDRDLLTVLDGDHNSVAETLPIPPAPSEPPTSMVADPAASRVYLSDHVGAIAVVDDSLPALRP